MRFSYRSFEARELTIGNHSIYGLLLAYSIKILIIRKTFFIFHDKT
jgi:hypothetical protein